MEPKGIPPRQKKNGLGMQVEFTLPYTLPLMHTISLSHQSLFYHAFMIVFGAHYPFHLCE